MDQTHREARATGMGPRRMGVLTLAAVSLLACSGCVLHRALVWPNSASLVPGSPGESWADQAATGERESLTSVAQNREPWATARNPVSGRTRVSEPSWVRGSQPPTITAAGTPARPRPEDPSEGSASKPDHGLNRVAANANQYGAPLVDPTPAVPPPIAVYPIDLTTALRLGEALNPQIAIARQQISAALALQQQAYALMIPTLNAGASYHGHTGNLQRSSGTILPLDQQILLFGAGVRAITAETVAIPGVNISTPITDAWFEPLAARQVVTAARYEAAATANTTLLNVAVAHLDLLYAEAYLQVQLLTQANIVEVARRMIAYAQIGQGRKADADRAVTETRLRHAEVQHAEEEVAVASARLARLLHLDPSVRLRAPVERFFPYALVDLSADTESLIQIALRQRPEMGARAATIGAAEVRYREELARPFLPFLWLGFSGGSFGGGSNIIPPFLGSFGGRTDFDARVYWTLQGLGFGNLNLQRQRRAQVGEAMAQQARMVTLIRREVASAKARALAARERVEVERRQLETATAGFQEDFLEIRQRARVKPIEVLDNLELLAEARERLVRAIYDANRAQLELFVALGTPPPLERPATEPLPPAPVAPPPLPPVANPITLLP
jgi:outer membrane protein TolC